MTIEKTIPAMVDDFERFIHLPENRDRRFEHITGEIIEVVSNNYSSLVAARILMRVGVYVDDNNLGYVTGADGGYRVGGNRFIPDVGYISKARQAEPSHEAYNTNAPDLAVEVLSSPTDDRNMLRLKVAAYLAAGTMLWVVDPDTKQVEVYVPGTPPLVLAVDATLNGGEVLPGFTLAVKAIFPAAQS